MKTQLKITGSVVKLTVFAYMALVLAASAVVQADRTLALIAETVKK
jgi:hypothetical protein